MKPCRPESQPCVLGGDQVISQHNHLDIRFTCGNIHTCNYTSELSVHSHILVQPSMCVTACDHVFNSLTHIMSNSTSSLSSPVDMLEKNVTWFNVIRNNRLHLFKQIYILLFQQCIYSILVVQKSTEH